MKMMNMYFFSKRYACIVWAHSS